MKHLWGHEELVEKFTLSSAERKLLTHKTTVSKLGLATLLKLFQHEGRFPRGRYDVPRAIVKHIADQINVPADEFTKYKWKGRLIEAHRSQIRKLTGYRKWSRRFTAQIVKWLLSTVIPNLFKPEQLKTAIRGHLRSNRIEPPAPVTMDRMISSALKSWEESFFNNITERLESNIKVEIDLLLSAGSNEIQGSLRQLKSDTGNISLNTIITEISKLNTIRKIGLPLGLFEGLSPKLMKMYRDRVITEPAREVRRHPRHIRYALMAIFLYCRHREIVDDLVELLIRTVKRIGARAEKKVISEVIDEFKKVRGKDQLLYKIVSAAWEQPDGIVRDVIFPVVGENTIRDIIREHKYSGPSYRRKVNTRMRASYRNYYRRMLPRILCALDFKSNNQAYRPIIEAIRLLRNYSDSQLHYYPLNEKVPTEGIIPAAWRELVYETDSSEHERIRRIAYELCVFEALCGKLRCKEIWVVGADRYRNPDDDLPADYEQNRIAYYSELGQPLDPEAFITQLQTQMDLALSAVNGELLDNPYVSIIAKGKGGRIKVSPLHAQSEPQNLQLIKSEINRRWQTVSLLDVLKESELRINFTRHFKSVAQREAIDRRTLQKRLLMNLYALATNAGTKRVAAGNHDEKYTDLMYVQRRFVRSDYLRQAIASVVNEIFRIRQPHIWGEVTTTCASDSKQFGAWDQNLLTEWHVRYGGRGIMVYWHVEKGAACIYSQLKNCSSSEVAAMIEGVIRHCTEMEVEKQYVDTHGQSFVGFAFCHLLGFKLLPRFKSIKAKKLYRPFTGKPRAYPNLQPILTRPINWELIRRQYDQMIKYATAIRLGTAETEAILRRFTRENLKHPTYQALLELGKAVRTIFLCEYIGSATLRREIQQGLNVIELWNGVNDFILFGKGGEFATNRRKGQELTVLSLHLLQNCMVYINTLMIQQVLADSGLLKTLEPEDFRALTPLIFNHINPYGVFSLDMDVRIPIESNIISAAA